MALVPIPTIPDGPQPEALPEMEFRDDTPVAPVPSLYIPKPIKVQRIASDRITTATYLLNALAPTRIVGRAEDGLASRITLTISQVAANVAISNNPEQLAGPFTGIGVVGTFMQGGFMIPASIGASGVVPPLELETCDELWAIAVLANAVSAAWISVLIEQFYGDS